MAKPNLRNLAQIRKQNPLLGQLIDDIASAIDVSSSATVTNPNGTPASPSAPSAINVQAADGIYHATATDHSPIVRGCHYYFEYDTDPAFSQPHVIDNGASRTWRGQLGDQNLHWRVYSQYPNGGPPSAPIVFGGQSPKAVRGGGAAGPPMVPSTGSGTANSDGKQGGSGAGKIAYRAQNGKPPVLGQ